MIETGYADHTLHDLSEVLQEERGHYEQLLELARFQGRQMTSHDLEGLEDSAQKIGDGLTAADEVRIRRERLASYVIQQSGAENASGLSGWLETQPPSVQQILAVPVQSVRRVAGELARTNEMNRRLANFCLDLVEEEAALLRRCLLEDPAGRYDSGAQPTQNEQGGVLSRQA